MADLKQLLEGFTGRHIELEVRYESSRESYEEFAAVVARGELPGAAELPVEKSVNVLNEQTGVVRRVLVEPTRESYYKKTRISSLKKPYYKIALSREEPVGPVQSKPTDVLRIKYRRSYQIGWWRLDLTWVYQTTAGDKSAGGIREKMFGGDLTVANQHEIELEWTGQSRPAAEDLTLSLIHI
jgi:hypothetical protein